MSFGFLGIQFGWGLQMANMSAIYEYLGARRPILALAPDDYEVAHLVRDAGAGVAIEATETERLEQYLESSYQAFAAGAEEQVGDGDIRVYERQYQAGLLAEMLNDLRVRRR